MELFRTVWRDGSSFNHGLTKEEYFYDQIYKAVEKNVQNRTLPFFNAESAGVPVELSTGKIINDENLIALEQIAAKQNFTSNIWIYGDTLEKMQHEGIRLNLKKGTEPALCLTKYANPTHLEKELYIDEGGAKTKAQFLYNYDSFDDRSKKAVEKYFSKANKINEDYTMDNFKNYLENLQKMKTGQVPQVERLKEVLKSINNEAGTVYSKSFEEGSSKSVNLAPIINASARHMCQVVTSAHIKNEKSQKNEELCYSLLGNMLDETGRSGGMKWKVGQAMAKAMDAGTLYAKSCTSKDFNFEIRKIKEENNHKKQILNSQRYGGVSY